MHLEKLAGMALGMAEQLFESFGQDGWPEQCSLGAGLWP